MDINIASPHSAYYDLPIIDLIDLYVNSRWPEDREVCTLTCDSKPPGCKHGKFYLFTPEG